MTKRTFATCAVILLLSVLTSAVSHAAERPQYPYQAELTFDGVVIASTNIAIGRFTKSEQQNGVEIGTFQCGEVLKGTWKNGQSYKLNTQAIQWRRVSDSKDIVVFWPGTPIGKQGDAIGKRKQIVDRIKDLCKKAEEASVGRINALGVHLQNAAPEVARPGVHRFSADVVNYSTVPYTVNVDKKVSPKPESHNRSIWIYITKSVPVGNGGAVSETLVYKSQRPWANKGIIDTAKARGRPDRPVPGATVRLQSGERMTLPLELRPTGKPDEFTVFINGHRDLGTPFKLEPSLYKVVVGLDDDYHYYTGNGAKIGTTDYWFGQVQSGELTLDLRPAPPQPPDAAPEKPSAETKPDADDGK